MGESLLMSLFGLGPHNWMNVAFLVMILLLLIFKPYNIRNTPLFYAGAVCFVLSLVLPAITVLTTPSTDTSDFSRVTRRDTSDQAETAATMMAVGKIAFATGLLLVIVSLVPTEANRLQHRRNETEDRTETS